VFGALLLAVSQAVMALSTDLPLTLGARVGVGLGDATAFISVLRLIPEWFPLRRVPLLNQTTGALGQLGQIISAVPFYSLLAVRGWTVAYMSLAATGLLVAILVLVVVRDRPADRPGRPTAEGDTPSAASPAAGEPARGARPVPVGTQIREVAREPGVWAALFSHWSTMFLVTTFALMWGVPYMREGNGMSEQAASTALVVGVVAMVVFGPVVGALSARFPHRRFRVIAAGVLIPVGGWVGVLLVPPPVPTWAVVLLAVLIYFGGAASNVAFDIARSHVPRERLGTATGLANTGGFIATLLAVQIVGFVLDHLGGSTPSATDFRIAMAAQGIVSLVGVVGLVIAARRAGPGSELPIRSAKPGRG
jgi:MFS family permease